MTTPAAAPPTPGRELVRLANEAGPVAPAYEEGAETSSVAAAAQARASVESRYLMALRNPRSIDQARAELLKACKRPTFAAGAMWSKPTGGKVLTGPSIRFAEEALRCFRNVLVETPVVHDSDRRRVVRVLVTDLEANLSFALDLALTKTVERRSAKGRVVVSERPNSDGEVVYLVEATEDELAVKQAAQVSKAIRTLGLRLLPGDVVEEALAQVRDTAKDQDAKDPDAAKKRIVDAFFDLGVSPADLERFLGHGLAMVQPASLQRLRLAFTALRDGEATWPELVAAAHAPADGDPATPGGPTSSAPGAAGLTGRLRTQRPRQADSGSPPSHE